jgi:hypothetical protein
MTDQVAPFLRQISSVSDTVLLFKEDKNPVAIIKDVSDFKKKNFVWCLIWMNCSLE